MQPIQPVSIQPTFVSQTSNKQSTSVSTNTSTSLESSSNESLQALIVLMMTISMMEDSSEDKDKGILMMGLLMMVVGESLSMTYSSTGMSVSNEQSSQQLEVLA